jgi:hypothetical protein
VTLETLFFSYYDDVRVGRLSLVGKVRVVLGFASVVEVRCCLETEPT